MRYRVYGRDVVTKRTLGPLFINADTEEAAREEAATQGMDVDIVEPAETEKQATAGRNSGGSNISTRPLAPTENGLARTAESVHRRHNPLGSWVPPCSPRPSLRSISSSASAASS